MRDFAKWNEDIQELLTMIVDRVSDTLDAWRFFDRADLEYFTDKSHQPYFRGIKRSMRKLEGYHETLQKLKERAKAKSEAISARIGLENHDATVNVHKLAVLAMVFAPLSTVVSLFGAEGLPFGTLNIRTFGLMLMGLVLVYGIVYWLIRNWKATVKPYARACGKRLSPFFDVVSVLSRIQGALQAGARVLAGGNDRIEMVSEFSVSEPPVAELPSPVQSRTRTGTWSSWSKSLRRRPTEEPQVELGDV
ncbi:hypothetical protein B0T16DRAFT_249757 [Cercophora newfieldiana]|uniref:Uncharacterized protein n=1 Tax=Cercophora newfieldiana TaxID=92897 RepID=A0AA39XUA3_9PEZI|nr:hypothetical protein B0T16DRAFT_249757 [Cercophora newfieldiana]